MSNETYWALKRREWASREQRGGRRRRANVPIRPNPPAPLPELEPMPEPSYRDLQAQAKELDIKANLPADELKAAIEKAG